MKDKLDVKYTLEDSNGNKYTILDTQRVDLQEELNKEIEKQAKEINRLHSIIKVVREYIEEHIKYECDNAFNGMQFYSHHLYDFNKKELLEILDKEYTDGKEND